MDISTTSPLPVALELLKPYWKHLSFHISDQPERCANQQETKSFKKLPIGKELRLAVKKAADAAKKWCSETEAGRAWTRHKAEIDEASMARNCARLRTQEDTEEEEDDDEDGEDDGDEHDDSSEHTDSPSSVTGSNDMTNDDNPLPSLDSNGTEPSTSQPESQRTLTINHQPTDQKANTLPAHGQDSNDN
ncbi:hypothetical protein CNYM01_06164 [Colletotrichum nymphaeae SA-01]|uniref:Uncharacterized protein n=1 Tax=Colletotrichum nymphaeae SA-01 TaxID=1460502 RepID=A0A135SRY8_9PEZI|nr:hypothetical protein CNYM01_06164 [Colletotrichum nymphaeae SA-01]